VTQVFSKRAEPGADRVFNEEDWISFAEAVGLLEQKYGSRLEAAQALHEKVATGHVSAVAREITRMEGSDIVGAGGSPSVHRSNWRIPLRLWRRTPAPADVAGDWSNSHFRSTVLGKLDLRSQDVQWNSYRMRNVAVDRAHINALAGAVGRASLATRAKAGRKPKFDWPAFDQHALCRLEYNGGFLGIDWAQTDLEGEMQAWALERWGVAPGESTIRDRITKIIVPMFEAGKAGQE
jgi:hypothetical protein